MDKFIFLRVILLNTFISTFAFACKGPYCTCEKNSNNITINKTDKLNSDSSAKTTPKSTQKELKLVTHEFDVIGNMVKVELPFQYKRIIPEETRLFFEGEALVIDPKTTPFKAFVTAPVSPCILGRVLDTQTGKLLIFHKFAIHSLESLKPFYEELGVKDSNLVEVQLYSCEQSEKEFQIRASYYEGRNQTQALEEVGNFLGDTFKIPSDNIETRFFKHSLHSKLPDLGYVIDCEKTVGVTQKGELFLTSIFDVEDVFGLSATTVPGKTKEYVNSCVEKYKMKEKDVLDSLALSSCGPFFAEVNQSIRETFFGNNIHLKNSKYGSHKFFSHKLLDVPMFSMGKLWGGELLVTEVKTTTPPDLMNLNDKY